MPARRKTTTRKAKRVYRKETRSNRATVKMAVLAIAVVVLSLGGLGTEIWAYYNTQIPFVIRDAGIAIVAHQKAGKAMPMDSVDYTGSMTLDVGRTWDIESNSIWLVQQTTLIIPVLVYEGIGGGQYPDAVVFLPFEREESFHVAGRMGCDDNGLCFVVLNERFLLDEIWIDRGEAIGTLTHELIHLQGGVFLDPPGATSWMEQSAILESATSAATQEALAAMCNYGNLVACRGFWLGIEGMARSSLRVRLQEAPWIYDLFSNIFLRDGKEERAARKSGRYWLGHQESLYVILSKYGQHPWESHLLPGVLDAKPIRTGNWVRDGNILTQSVMFWDDTRDLLGIWYWWLDWLTR